MISQEVIEDIKKQADIVTVISSFIEVQKAGNDFVAVCPFHNDTNPSLRISTSKQIFKCFVCGTSGNVFSFVMKYMHVGFIEAVKKVCEICNIHVKELEDYTPVKKVREHEEEHKALEELQKFYSYMLNTKEGKEAKEYLLGRNLDEGIIEHFKIGYAPLDNTQAINVLRNKLNFSVDVLDRAGITNSESSSFRDRYIDRVIFPLDDINGDIVGFSGRIYHKDSNDSKYVNSRESLLFRKSQLLYNSSNALKEAKRVKYLYVVEGFMDVIALYKVGINSAVALMGTALTKEHVDLFKKMNIEIRLCLDSDDAGQLATERIMPMFYEAKVKFKVVKPFKEAKDADDTLNIVGKEKLLSYLNELEEPILHSLNYASTRGVFNSYERKEKFLLLHKDFVSTSSFLAREEIFNKLAEVLEISSETLKSFYRNSDVRAKRDVPIQVIDIKKYDKKVCYNSLYEYIQKMSQEDLIRSKRASGLVMNEARIMARIVMSRKYYERFINEDCFFRVSEFQTLLNYIENCYLKGGVYYISEENYIDIENEIELYASNAFSDDTSANSFTNEKRKLLDIVEIMKNSTYPGEKGEDVDLSIFDRLVDNHRENLLKLDVTNTKLDDESRYGVLEKLTENYSKKLEK